MYASRTTQFIVGIFALLGILALVYLSVRLGRVAIFPPPGYTVYANFDNVSGLKAGDQVSIAGVDIGKVTGIELHNYRASVTLHIDPEVKIDDQAIAAIKSSGLIGDKFVSIALGPGDHDLTNGGVIRHTESSVVLEDLIGQLINGSATGSASNNAQKPKPSSADQITTP
jgi:phospholipid/cholesterol/gamma-HCH transport system substrate-binding protein